MNETLKNVNGPLKFLKFRVPAKKIENKYVSNSLELPKFQVQHRKVSDTSLYFTLYLT